MKHKFMAVAIDIETGIKKLITLIELSMISAIRVIEGKNLKVIEISDHGKVHKEATCQIISIDDFVNKDDLFKHIMKIV